mgnify:CR=1 FL=1
MMPRAQATRAPSADDNPLRRLERLWADFPYQCLERQPQDGDLPDSAAEFVLPVRPAAGERLQALRQSGRHRLPEVRIRLTHKRTLTGGDRKSTAPARRCSAMKAGFRSNVAVRATQAGLQ